MPLVNKTFSDIITFTRASAATYFDSAGVLQSAANDAPRLDYDPATLLPRGFLVEEQRTNSIRNNTMQGAVAGTPGTLPTNWTAASIGGVALTEVVGTGVEDGIAYVDVRYAGTTSSTSSGGITAEATTEIVAASGQTWTNSLYVRLVNGSLSGIDVVANTIQERDAGGNLLAATNTPIIPTTAPLNTQRVDTNRTLNNASTAFVNPQVRLTPLSGAAIDITLRIGLPQLEQGAFATSVIPTTTTALTRSADVASVNTLSPWFNASEGTLYSESVLARQSTIAGTNTFFITNGSNSDIRLFYRGSGATGAVVIDSGSTQADMSPTGILTANTTAKLALAYKVDDFAVSGNGGAVVVDPLGSVPTGMSQVLLGGPNGILNGYLRRITYYPRRLSNAELVSITS